MKSWFVQDVAHQVGKHLEIRVARHTTVQHVHVRHVKLW